MRDELASERPFEIGWCTNDLRQAKSLGFDYVECGARKVAKLSDHEFETLVSEQRALGVRTPVANVFLPPQLKIVGPATDHQAEMAYVDKVLARLRRLEVEVLVFGSAKSREVPEGFSSAAAFEQLVGFGKRLAPRAEAAGVVVAIEPVGRPECNIIVDSAEALRLVRAIDHPSVQLMIDLYHFHKEGEAPEALLAAADHIRHVHIANPEPRRFPRDRGEFDYQSFFGQLRRAGYAGRLSIEAPSPGDLGVEAPRAIALLRTLATPVRN